MVVLLILPYGFDRYAQKGIQKMIFYYLYSITGENRSFKKGVQRRKGRLDRVFARFLSSLG
ncbi:MAG: hypothetical protein B1H12_09455 [Desulfobacteraceae bacterium 4484_190.2]|nr:MAG: hypothetical protein B1H12_09455 [Desulfobacteraceae bacterium 4484_190.2]